jgi:hypothetical protein
MGRYEDLIAKRDSAEGLTDEEANELGQIIAERDGEPYANADDPPPEVEAERRSKPEEATEDEVETERDVDDSVLTEEREKGREVDNPPVA